ncbi:hypothetical protein [Aquimarina sp. MMG016]|uniref:hypothetical protein n=1 Tax=Aquimarina sp. MMG016 TaxID=2822690 RepID=UPI001B3A5660|nr:hypothetical protein [Aquimarina sp. MMG016]MBQ4819498.1 hypothetical protein [Aquimarina sp. MMG016]
MSKDFLKLETSRKLSREEQKNVNGGGIPVLIRSCVGTGTLGGSPGDEGTSPACVGRDGDCLINGYEAVCSGNDRGGFWFK